MSDTQRTRWLRFEIQHIFPGEISTGTSLGEFRGHQKFRGHNTEILVLGFIFAALVWRRAAREHAQ